MKNPKPCPWCGRNWMLEVTTFGEDGQAVKCRCGARGPTTSYNPTSDREAWRRWQKRKHAALDGSEDGE